MITSKEQLLKMKPTDMVFLPITKLNAPKIIDLKENVDFLILTFQGKSEQYALVLSGEEETKRFYELGIDAKTKLCFREIRIQDLFSMLMVNHLHLLIDPFGDTLVTITPQDMCDYCVAHQEEIYKKNTFELPAYVNFRVAKAKRNGKEEKKKLLKDLVEFGVFYVASPPGVSIAPCICQIGNIDQRSYLMLFSLESIASRFCAHSNHKDASQHYMPMRVTLEDLKQLNPARTGVNMVFLNDGSEGISFSYDDLINSF